MRCFFEIDSYLIMLSIKQKYVNLYQDACSAIENTEEVLNLHSVLVVKSQVDGFLT